MDAYFAAVDSYEAFESEFDATYGDIPMTDAAYIEANAKLLSLAMAMDEAAVAVGMPKAF